MVIREEFAEPEDCLFRAKLDSTDWLLSVLSAISIDKEQVVVLSLSGNGLKCTIEKYKTMQVTFLFRTFICILRFS